MNRYCEWPLSATVQVAHTTEPIDLGVGVAWTMSPSGCAVMKGNAPFAPRGPLPRTETMPSGAGHGVAIVLDPPDAV